MYRVTDVIYGSLYTTWHLKSTTYFCGSYWKFVEKHPYLSPNWDPTCVNMYHVDTHTFIKRKNMYLFEIIHVSRFLDITDCFQNDFFFCQIMNSFIGCCYYCFNDSLNDINMRQRTWDFIISFRCQNEATGASLIDGPLMYLHHDTICTGYDFPLFYFPFLCSL